MDTRYLMAAAVDIVQQKGTFLYLYRLIRVRQYNVGNARLTIQGATSNLPYCVCVMVLVCHNCWNVNGDGYIRYCRWDIDLSDGGGARFIDTHLHSDSCHRFRCIVCLCCVNVDIDTLLLLYKFCTYQNSTGWHQKRIVIQRHLRQTDETAHPRHLAARQRCVITLIGICQ